MANEGQTPLEIRVDVPSQDDLTTDEEEEAPYYVITKGRNESDIGIYRSWAEVQPRVNGVSGANHKRLETYDQALEYMEEYGDSTQQDNGAKPNLRQRSRPDYRAISGNKPKDSKKEKNKRNTQDRHR